ncbi:DUF58 domain-containing protein [Paenibacillus sp. MMS20-IR301]|uniref:DUF58 domain-containing protein n=1 Tax=Paenibacillus sp. MMS20-IR301 TaxID=2895946 RepID=UPI0028ECE548|nr:DUF58 domain-containing protein [Paenibacillus sp. MMS20-IR301]WNS41635.1 DUF58 domain-containing protein [Paenibacillus sp. MMS20-IR301]
MTEGRVSSLSSSSLLDQKAQEPKQENRNGQPEAEKQQRQHPRSALWEWGRMLALIALALGLYLWRGGESLLLLLITCGLVSLGGLLLQLCGPRKLTVLRTVSPPRPSAGDNVTVKVQIRFVSTIPLPWIIVTDEWSGGGHKELLFPGFRRSFTYTYTLESVSRGVHRLNSSSLVWGDLPGLFTGGWRQTGRESFRVLPRALYTGWMRPDSHPLPGEYVLPGRGKQGSAEAADIRDYAPGDPLSRIHWKSSARKGTLQSKTPEREAGRMNCIVLANSPEDYEIPYGALVPRGQRAAVMPAFEQAVSAAMGMLLTAERTGAYIQLYSGGWPEGMARHEGLGQIPGRVQNLLTEITPTGTQSLSRLLEDASRSWIPGMTVSVITGRLEEAAARTLARYLVQGLKVELYYVWDLPSPGNGGGGAPVQKPAGTIAGSLMRLGARIHCLNDVSPAQVHKEAEYYGPPGKPTSG